MEMTPSAHLDSFCRDRLPPSELWPELLFDLPELAYPERLNCARVLLDDTVARVGAGRRCLITPGGEWSYGVLVTRVNEVANVLVAELGLVPGNRVLLRGPNSPWLVACWLGVLKAGGVVVTTMPMLRATELSAICEVSAPSIALCDHRYLEELELVEAPGLLRVAYGGDASDDLTVRCAGARGEFEAVDTAADDIALIAFTSGSTGKPKATMHFHRDVLANADTFARHLLRPTPDDVFAGTPPLAFTLGLGGLVVFPLRFGAASLLLEQATPVQLAEHVAAHRVSILFTAPTAYRAILAAGLGDRLKGVRCAVSAGEPLPVAVSDALLDATGARPIDGIGATEMLHIFISAAGADIRPGSTGRPVPGYRAAILDGAGQPVPDGQPGFLAVKGPTGCRYLSDERQATYVRNGWNVTGDTYIRDADGYFWFQARADDMIISSGYNIAGPEVEQALLSHPNVADCAVAGAPDSGRGMIVKAFVVLRDGAEAGPGTVRALQDHVKHTIAPYKYPRAVEFVPELPRTPTGKLDRGRIRARARDEETPEASAGPAAVVVERRVEWQDTDAAGHYHFSTVLRWVEAAEWALLDRLGATELFGRIPRVHFDADFTDRLWLGELVEIELRAAKVGTASLHYAFEITGPRGPAATGAMTVVHAAVGAEGSTPWPDHIRRALTAAGPQQPERFAVPEQSTERDRRTSCA